MRKSRSVALALMALCWSSLAAGQEGKVVTKLEAWGDLSNSLHVRWITKPPTKAQVEFGPTQELGRAVEEDPDSLRGTTNNRDSGVGWANNHRADIPGIKAWPVHLRVAGLAREGGHFQSKIIVVRAPKQPVGKTTRATIPITVHPGGWKLQRLPITVGVPFPKGELASPGNVRVMCDGKEILSQTKVVTRWREDHSIKWLRLDFVAPGTKPAVFLEYGTAVKRQDYGPAAKLPELVASPQTLASCVVDAEGKTYTGRHETVVVEEAGPVKTVVRFDGRYVADDGAKLCAFTFRTHFWPSAKLFRMDYTFRNDNVESEFTSLRSVVYTALSGGRREHIQVGFGDEAIVLREGERVLQREDSEWVKEPSGQTGRRLAGLLQVGGDYGVVRDFWQQWPIAIGLRDGHVTLGFCPELPEGFYANRKDEDKLYYQIRDGRHTFRQGFTKTWEIWSTGLDADAAASLLGERPVASLPPAWIENSGALQKLAVAVGDGFPGYDEALAQGIDKYLRVRDQRREYGMMNFGDWYGERTWNWGNLEYDLGHGFLTQFMRAGKPEFYWRAEECLRHERDVDTRHYAQDPRRIGQQWTHCIGHTAGYYPKEYKGMKVYASPGWSDNRGHVWAQGMFEHYLLGGDTRSWETAKLIADWAAGPQTTNFRFGNAREPGWMTKLVMSAYLATEDPYYLNAARIMLDKVHEQSLATGDHGFYYHKLSGGHCRCPEGHKHSGEAGFMLGVLMTGMKMYYDETGDERVAEDIVKIARFIVDTMWVPQELGFRYTSCPKTGLAGGSAWIMMQGLAFAARHSGDAKLADVCRKSLAAAWDYLPTSGKSAGYILCSSAQALEEVAHLPGVSFAECRAEIERALKSPARRPLPTNVPNPDFEAGIEGWPSRGVVIERSTEVKHSGEASLKISGKMVRQNEYVNTRYDTHGGPYEITWLKPGRTYRLTAWLRVDKAAEGTPAPDLRLAFRDDTGTKGAKYTSGYDLTQLGTWQKLTADIAIPEWNTRNYIALNTKSREAVEVEMYLDDVSLVPVEAATADAYAYYRLDPSAATLSGEATVRTAPLNPGEQRLSGPGGAEWKIELEQAGRYVLWARAEGGVRLGRAAINGHALSAPEPPQEPTWVRLGAADLKAGQVTVKLQDLPAGPQVGRLVLTNDPSSSL